MCFFSCLFSFLERGREVEKRKKEKKKKRKKEKSNNNNSPTAASPSPASEHACPSPTHAAAWLPSQHASALANARLADRGFREAR